MQKATQFTPLTKLADIAVPDSDAAREFTSLVDQVISAGEQMQTRISPTGTKHEDANTQILKRMLIEWANMIDRVVFIDALGPSPMATEAEPLLKDLSESSRMGFQALSLLEYGTLPETGWRAQCLEMLGAAAQPKAAVELMIVQPIKELVIAAAEQEKRKTMSAEEWKKMIKEMAAPKRR